LADIDLDDVIQRVVAMEKEATVNDLAQGGLPALDYLAGQYETTPYLTNGIGQFTFSEDPEDTQNDSYVVRMRLIVGHVTQGYKGSAERLLRYYIPVIRKYFAAHPNLTTDSSADGFNVPPHYLHWSTVKLTGGNGTLYFKEPSIATQVGTEFQLLITTTDSIY
jgi:hypothetical protein